MLAPEGSAAFPSLSRDWVFAVLFAMQLPGNIIEAVQNLYSNNHHIYRSGHKILYAFLGAAVTNLCTVVLLGHDISILEAARRRIPIKVDWDPSQNNQVREI